jgi:cytochrome c2
MKARTICILTIILTLTLLVAACSSGSSSNTAAPSNDATVLDGETLFQERCSACHELTRATDKQLTAAEWKAIVDKMISKGAKLTADEGTLVVDYLTENYGK